MDVVAAHRQLGMETLCAELLGELERFAAGAPQEDDITVVLVKREESE